MASSKVAKIEATDDVDHADNLFNVRAFLKRASDEFKETSERYAVISKQYEASRTTAIWQQTAACDRTLADIKGITTTENSSIEKLIKESQKFLHEHPLKSELNELHQLSGGWSYLMVIRRVQEIGSRLKSSFETSDWTGFVESFTKDLNSNVLQRLETSSCTNLFNWVKQYSDAWRRHSSARISSIIVDYLEKANIPQDVLHADKRLIEEIRPLSQALLDISLSPSSKESEPFSIVANALLRPFVKRFVHHFCGGKGDQFTSGDLNKLTTIKPEWYLSIVVKWHRQFTSWVEQLNLDCKVTKADLDSKNEKLNSNSATILSTFFAQGLVDLACKRFKADLIQYSQDYPEGLPHLIDEAISFDTDIKALGYPENEPGCVDILTEPGVFELWAQLEQTEATKCMEAFLREPEAWLLRYGDNISSLGDQVDSHKIPLVTDKVLLMLSAMKHRFRLVRSQEHRRIFVQMQCALLHDFRDRLSELSRDLSSPLSSEVSNSKKEPCSPTFAKLVNSCSYICAVLMEWQETPAYLSIRTACFEDIIELFDQTRRSLLRDACAAVLRDIQASIDEYRRSFAFYTGRGDLPLSAQATAYLYTPLQEALSILHQTLSRKNFLTFARQLAAGLDKMLVERVVLELRLEQKSGEELQRQLGVLLVKVTFENYGVVGAGAYFTRLVQYLHIASMNAGNCTLLKEALKERRMPAEHVLSEMGLENISAQEVEDLLHRRSDLM